MRLNLLAAAYRRRRRYPVGPHGGPLRRCLRGQRLRNRPPAVPTFFLNPNSCATGYGISVESLSPLPPKPNTRLLILPFLQRTSTQIGFVFSFLPIHHDGI